MAVGSLPGRSGVGTQSVARIQGPRDLRRDLRRVPPWTGRRSLVRSAIPGKELLVLQSLEEPQRPEPGFGGGPEGRRRHGHGPGAGQCSGVTKSRRSRLPRHAGHARPRNEVEMSRYSRLRLDGNAVLARPDDRGGPCQHEMDGGTRPRTPRRCGARDRIVPIRPPSRSIARAR
jgi:hypothetical protein